jgi:hypothetical protein
MYELLLQYRAEGFHTSDIRTSDNSLGMLLSKIILLILNNSCLLKLVRQSIERIEHLNMADNWDCLY